MKRDGLILVVEDNQVLLQSTVQALQSAGHEVLAASTAKECLSLAKEKQPDMLLLDVVLPDIDGVEVCRRIKADHETAGIFVVLISAYQITSKEQVAGLEAGAEGYITRPINQRELLARVQTLLRLQQAQQALCAVQEELERRVSERTAELTQANARLQAEMAERQQLEARLLRSQKLQAIGQLAAGIAHDFNNILTVIQCSASLLQQEKELGPGATECAQQISMAGQRAAELTRQLLAFTRQQVYQPRELDLNALAEDMRKMLGRTLGEHILLRFDLTSALPAVKADPGMLEQAILNLAINARDAMPDGGQLTIQTGIEEIDTAAAARRPEARPGSFVRLSVSDTGCGMDMAVLEHMFEPFFTTKGAGKGTGLGLASVHGIAGQHQGWVEVTSEPGHGSMFSIYLPSLRASARPTVPTAVAAPQRQGSETILLVEDDPAVRVLVSGVLERHGYRVLVAASGFEALQTWRQHQGQVDLLLADILMPQGFTGGELAALLQQGKPGLKVILTSGYGADLVRKGLSLATNIRFLPKPFNLGLLTQTVADCLDGPHTLSNLETH